MTLTVRPVEDPPRALDDDAETHVDTPVTIAVTANDSDPDGDTVSLLAVVTAPSNGVAQGVDAARVLYTPVEGFQGTDTFEYEIDDGKGNTDRAVVTVAVTNKAPDAVDDSVAVRKDTRLVIEVLANDTDPDGDEILLPDEPVVIAPLHGTARRQGRTKIRYEPHPGFEGTDTFVYEVVDVYGLGATANVTVTVSDELPPEISSFAPKKIVRGKTTTSNGPPGLPPPGDEAHRSAAGKLQAPMSGSGPPRWRPRSLFRLACAVGVVVAVGVATGEAAASRPRSSAERR